MGSGRIGEDRRRKPVFGILEPRVLLSANGELVEPPPGIDSGDNAAVNMADTDDVAGVLIATVEQAPAGVDESVTGPESQPEAALASVGEPAIATAAEAANQPIGEAKGIHPGRVAWVHDPAATLWDGSTGYWWDDANTDQLVVESMFSDAIQWLTGQQTDAAAWSALFGHFNSTRLGESVGYTPGEKIAIKANLNNAESRSDADNHADTSPQVIMALLRSLVYDAGVAPGDIALYDVSRTIPDRLYDRIAAEFPEVQCVDKDGGDGRTKAEVDQTARVHYSNVPDDLDSYLPTVVTEADYLVNLANLKKHGQAGVTLTGKNHFGSVATLAGKWTPADLHQYTYLAGRATGSASPIVDLMGHEQLGGKTLLYLVDGLYGASNNARFLPVKWQTLGNHWSSSLLVSQDPVAIDSVGADILAAEWGIAEGADDYLHQAATAGDIKSWGLYDPDGNGTGLASLGTHEHWNNDADRQYSRNLGTGVGIELITESLSANEVPTVSITTPTAGADLPAGGDVAITAAATDLDGTVTKVEFYANGQYIGVDADPSGGWTAMWTDAATGDWALSAKAFDDAGEFGLSQPVTIRVSPYLGDFNGDGAVDASDIDAVVGVIRAGTNDPAYNLTGESPPIVDKADMDELVWNLVFVNGNPLTRGTSYGDANLDGSVNDADLSLLLANWGIGGVGWAEGSFCCNNESDDNDLSLLLANWHEETSPMPVEMIQTVARQTELPGDAPAASTGEPVALDSAATPATVEPAVATLAAVEPAAATLAAVKPASVAPAAPLPDTFGQNPLPATTSRASPGLYAPPAIAELDDDLVDLLGQTTPPLPL